MSKKISLSAISGDMTADELETLRWTHETTILINYQDEELSADECWYVYKSLTALGLEVHSIPAHRKNYRLLKVHVPHGVELVA